MEKNFAIKTINLGRIYKKGKRIIEALKNINIEVNRGEIFGLLGPNGAGKTTLIKILTTILLPTTGKAYVLGFDVEKDTLKIREKINMVSGGEWAGYGILTVKENLWMFSQFYGIPSKLAKKEIEKYLEIFDLKEEANTKISNLSTGMRQKMNFIRGILSDPEVLFLDEPTLGLDVQVARTVRNFIKDWIKEKPIRTILLTTHYLHEADELCDRIAIIDNGQIYALDTPENLKNILKDRIYYSVEVLRNEYLKLDSIPYTTKFFVNPIKDGKIEIKFQLESENRIVDVFNFLKDKGFNVLSFKKREPTLEDVFIEIVGREFKDEEIHS
ncbi:MAG: ABC transporter ATP-binding protein [Caldisericia bacterium]|jgi:ABC-2 type transport system ATP-binding protein|nr:ABC transporter ATP-binding protein [Caldisericia bacterium]